MIRAVIIALLFAAAACTHAHAQQPAVLPDSVAVRLVAFYNSDTTTRLGADAHIAAGTTVRGGVALVDGTLTIDGAVEGDVVVINGDLVIRDGARVTGDVTVTGGRTRVEGSGTVAGTVITYREPLPYRFTAAGIAHAPAVEEGLAAGRDFGFGRTDLLIASHGAYNRAEGLPLAIGPRIRFAGAYPTTARALMIIRTATTSEAASELDLDRFGYDVRVEQVIAPAAGLTVGARLYSEVDAIESWGTSDRESALSTFVLHRDMRDHYERDGWSLYTRLQRPGSRYRAELAYRDEHHRAVPPADPFALFYRSRGWRPEPSVGEGDLRMVAADATYDTRNEVRDPSAGWHIRVGLEKGLGGSLDNPGAFDPELLAMLRRPVRADYITMQTDIRRYARLSPYARLAVRVAGAASLDGEALPPQRQHALGGEGSLPGYRLFEFDCGARINTVDLRGDRYHPYYGCDQVALIQVEYQAGFPFGRRLAREIGITGSVGQLVRWVAFFDAGRAWNEPGAHDGRAGGNDDFSADGGLGLRVGPLGMYWAVPLSGGRDGFNFFIRLGPRI